MKFKLTHTKRRYLCISILILTVITLILDMILLIFMYYNSYYIPVHGNIIPLFLALAIPISVIIIAAITIVVCFISIKTWSRVMSNDITTQKNIQSLVSFTVCLHAITAILFFLLGFATLIYKNDIDSSSKRFKNAMKKYRYEPYVKTQIDELQIMFKCCGGNGYKDWIKLKWEDEFYKITDGNVPFSCCDTWSPRVCIHTAVEDDDQDAHKNYQFEQDLTLYKDGCGNLIDSYLTFILVIIAVLCLFLCLTSLLILFMARLVQTSFLAALERYCNPQACASGHLLIRFSETRVNPSAERIALMTPVSEIDLSPVCKAKPIPMKRSVYLNKECDNNIKPALKPSPQPNKAKRKILSAPTKFSFAFDDYGEL